MEQLWQELLSEFSDGAHLWRVFARLALAAGLGAVLGYEREKDRKSAGLRTHMLVALGAALFVLVARENGMSTTDLSRVIQGVAVGIGFLGAGTIVKATDEKNIRGLTSSATIWLTAAVGLAVGTGWIWPAVVGVFLGWVILSGLERLEQQWGSSSRTNKSEDKTRDA